MTGSPPLSPHDDRVSSARTCDLVSRALSLAETFRQEADGHHARLRQFLQDAFALFRRFGADPEAWSELRRDPFWLGQRRKPKQRCNGRDLLLFLTQSTSANERSRAAKYAMALEFLLGAEIPEDQVAAFIAKAGGIDAVHRNALVVARSAPPLNGAAREGSEDNFGTDDGDAHKGVIPVRHAGAVVAATARRELAQAGETNTDAYVAATADIVIAPGAFGLNLLSARRRRPGKGRSSHSIVIKIEDADFDRLVKCAAPETPSRRVLFEALMSTGDPPEALGPVKILEISPVYDVPVGGEATASAPGRAAADENDVTQTLPKRATPSEGLQGSPGPGRKVQIFRREDRVREVGRKLMA
jgi:hypothetical protein